MDLSRPFKSKNKAFDLHALLPASLACGDESECNAYPARTALRMFVVSILAGAVLMTGLLLLNVR